MIPLGIMDYYAAAYNLGRITRGLVDLAGGPYALPLLARNTYNKYYPKYRGTGYHRTRRTPYLYRRKTTYRRYKNKRFRRYRN